MTLYAIGKLSSPGTTGPTLNILHTCSSQTKFHEKEHCNLYSAPDVQFSDHSSGFAMVVGEASFHSPWGHSRGGSRLPPETPTVVPGHERLFVGREYCFGQLCPCKLIFCIFVDLWKFIWTGMEVLDGVEPQMGCCNSSHPFNHSPSRYSNSDLCHFLIRLISHIGLLVWNLSLEVSQDPSDEYIQNLLYATDIACTILSLFTTLTGTSLIVCRLLRVGRISGTGKYWSTIEIVVESSMLYSVALIFDMVILLTQVSYDGYALGILAPITVRGFRWNIPR